MHYYINNCVAVVLNYLFVTFFIHSLYFYLFIIHVFVWGVLLLFLFCFCLFNCCCFYCLFFCGVFFWGGWGKEGLVVVGDLEGDVMKL